MTAIYASEPAGEGRERIDCAGFEELDRGLALSSDAGERIAYVPYERLIAVEPK